jgi:surfeit locus 1 family protein
VTGRRRVTFVALMLALTALFAGLGYWQMQRLAWKNELIAAVEARADLAAEPLLPAALWDGIFPDDYDFRPVTLAGEYTSDAPVLVFTSLSEPKGALGGPGFWVMQLFALQGGGRIWVNRGFVPEAADVPPPPPGERVLSGLMRRPEEANWFSPASDAAGRRDYVRDPLRFPPPMDEPGAIVAPFTIDLPAGEAALPQGGETVMEFPNRHFEYALTWFSLAVLTPVLMLLALRRKA